VAQVKIDNLFISYMLNVAISSFAYEKRPILSDISFTLEKGEHLAILGESGCGKSTLLHLIYGLLPLDNATITWNEQALLGSKHNLIPGELFIKLVAQEFNVMPFISVAENIATHLPRLDVNADMARVDELLEVVDLTAFKDVHVKNLSGGQKQRVALAKALAQEPEILLLDEPFSHIDTFRKNALRRDLFAYLKKKNIACITATHDADEALAFADMLMILDEGTVVRYGKPQDIYSSLKTTYEVGFFGDVNVLPKRLFTSESDPSEMLLLLPHQLTISEEKTPLNVTVLKTYYKGSHYLIEATSEEKTLFFEHPIEIKSKTKIFLQIHPE